MIFDKKKEVKQAPRKKIHTWIVAQETGGTSKVLPSQGRVILVVLTKHIVQFFRPSDAV
jgi:hypothetical protein